MSTLEYIVVRQAITNYFHTQTNCFPFYSKGGTTLGVAPLRSPNEDGRVEVLAKLEANRNKTIDEIIAMDEFKKFL